MGKAAGYPMTYEAFILYGCLALLFIALWGMSQRAP
jgi:hypothetical protein